MMLKDKLKIYCELIDEELNKLFMPDDVVPLHLQEVMAYSVMAGGKRLRPALVLETCKMLGGNIESAIPYACAIELIHTYSLIHDDLPCLDNDDMRRGRPTSHKQFDERRALLAGDALLSYAFEIMLKNNADNPTKENVLAANEIAHAAGIYGMVAGQWQDVLSEGTAITEEELRYIHQHKTADMICGAIRAGARIASATEIEMKKLTQYACMIGLAFQITDDILDVVGDSAILGKNTGSDALCDKVTYVSLYGVDAAKEKARDLITEACNVISEFENAEFFVELANFIVEREN